MFTATSVHCVKQLVHNCALRHIRKTLSIDDAKTVASELIGSRLDHANSVLYDVSKRIQNSLVRVNTCAKLRAESSRLLIDLHWLPIKHRIDFKMATLTFKILSTAEPSYLASLVSNYVPGIALRSADLHLCTYHSLKL